MIGKTTEPAESAKGIRKCKVMRVNHRPCGREALVKFRGLWMCRTHAARFSLTPVPEFTFEEGGQG